LLTLPALRKTTYSAPLLPAFGGVALCESEAPPLSPEGLLADDAADDPANSPEDGALITFEDLRADGAHVKQHSRIVFRAATAAYARHLTHLTDALRPMDAAQRESRLRQEFDRLLNARAAKRRLARYERMERLLRFECGLLFLIVFVLLPPFAYFRGLLGVWPLALGAIVLIVRILWIFKRTHRALFRGTDTGRGAQLVEMGLMPLAAMRAPDRLQREVFGNFHWLAVSAATLPADEARELAGRAVRELEFLPADEPSGNASSAWLRREWRAAVWRHVESEYGNPHELLSAPERRFPESITYCPCCCEEYLLAEGVCQDCAGVQLRTFG
jgi:hypothetical protein